MNNKSSKVTSSESKQAILPLISVKNTYDLNGSSAGADG